MTIKQQLTEAMKRYEEISLKDIYVLVPSVKKEAIRSVLNASVKANTGFIRVSKGTYKVMP